MPVHLLTAACNSPQNESEKQFPEMQPTTVYRNNETRGNPTESSIEDAARNFLTRLARRRNATTGYGQPSNAACSPSGSASPGPSNVGFSAIAGLTGEKQACIAQGKTDAIAGGMAHMRHLYGTNDHSGLLSSRPNL